MAVKDKIEEYYSMFRGLPSNNPIVRQNQNNDAFEIVVYDLLFRNDKYSVPLSLEDLSELEKYIVAPPDDAIDIFYEEDNGDDYVYHIVQVKNMELAEADIKSCFASMKRSIDTFLKKRIDVNRNLRQVISDTSFDSEYKNSCKYYVVHSGDKSTIKGQKEDESIVTLAELETIYKSIVNFCVPYEQIVADDSSNFVVYQNIGETHADSYKAYQVNLNAYDLGVLCNKYINSEIGKNILFGQNLREALASGSKTHDGMCLTIDTEPNNFWFYNNGITIIAEELDIKKIDGVENVILRNFSIINGAQTTSTFGKYLKDAQRDGEREKIEKLKRVFVSARVVETKENDELRKKITIYNNTQNPISTRDMVSNNVEQIKLQRLFLGNPEPYIFIQIRRGESKPKNKIFDKHQIITNDELAQLVFAGFLSSPFIAKDKKNSLFNRDNSTNEYEINKEYHQIFNFSENPSERGELFKRTKEEINELLFVKMLHNKAKKMLKDSYTNRIDLYQRILDDPQSDEASRDSAIRTSDTLKKMRQINNINYFYNVTLYYEYKRQFSKLINAESKKYDYSKFYNKDKSYEVSLTKAFADVFNTETIELILELGGVDTAKFVRAKASQQEFLKKLSQKLAISIGLQEKYQKLVEEFMI